MGSELTPEYQHYLLKNPEKMALDPECYGGFGRGNYDIPLPPGATEEQVDGQKQKPPVPSLFGKGAGAAALLGVKPKKRKY